MCTPVSLPSGSLVSLTEGQGSSQRQAALSISPLPLPSAPCSSLPVSPCLSGSFSLSFPFSSESGSHPAFPHISQQQEVVLAPGGWKPQEAALPLKPSLFPVFLRLVSIPFIKTPLASPRPLLLARTQETQVMGQIESHGCASPRRPEVLPGAGPPLSYLTGTFLPSPATPQAPDPRIRAELCEEAERRPCDLHTCFLLGVLSQGG